MRWFLVALFSIFWGVFTGWRGISAVADIWSFLLVVLPTGAVALTAFASS